MMFPMLRSIILSFVITVAAQAASSVRLHEIGTVRFIARDGVVVAQHGLLNSLGGFQLGDEVQLPTAVSVPDSAMNRQLVHQEAWDGYRRLGPEAVINFVTEEGTVVMVGGQPYLRVAASPEPKLSDGRLINLSTRSFASASDKCIAGFVIDERHRWVLVRAIGPGLAQFDVGNPMANPYLTLYRNNMPIYFNGDWSTRPDSAAIAEAAKKTGAFPLAPGSKDAALLVELPPGVYSAHVEPESGEGGTVLVEVYSVPEA